MHNAYVLFTLLSLALGAVKGDATAITPSETCKSKDDVFYHIFVRSFRDSNGDRHGDIKGITESLEYIANLGASGILLSPIFKSGFYHNYFSSDFESIDPDFGTREDLLELVHEAHKREIKVILDTEFQYVSEDHPWFQESFGNPDSPFASFIYYNDELNLEPDTGYLGWEGIPTYDRRFIKFYTVNLNSPVTRHRIRDIFMQLVDPNGDGDPSDGVDGFRIDHMMDNLDEKGKIRGMLTQVWRPMFDALRRINPKIIIVGEQSDWGFGEKQLLEGGADAVFAIPLAFSFRSLNKTEISRVFDLQKGNIPDNKNVFVFLENHDTDRYASIVGSDQQYLRMGALLSTLSEGVPIIYYGQELGATGLRGDWNSDGNDIPIREALRWQDNIESSGTALWYKDSGPWWRQSNLVLDTYKSVASQALLPDSIYNFYRQLLSLRRKHPALCAGEMNVTQNSSRSIISITRQYQDQRFLILLNPDLEEQTFTSLGEERFMDVLTGEEVVIENDLRVAAKTFRVLLKTH